MSFPCVSDGKVSACNVGDLDLIPGLGRSFGEGHDNPLQYSCLENPMDRRAWWATVHRVTKSWTQLKQLNIHYNNSCMIIPLFFFLTLDTLFFLAILQKGQELFTLFLSCFLTHNPCPILEAKKIFLLSCSFPACLGYQGVYKIIILRF